MKFSIQDFFSKCDQIGYKLRIWSHLLKKTLMENFIFCAVWLPLKSQKLKLARVLREWLAAFYTILDSYNGPSNASEIIDKKILIIIRRILLHVFDI